MLPIACNDSQLRMASLTLSSAPKEAEVRHVMHT